MTAEDHTAYTGAAVSGIAWRGLSSLMIRGLRLVVFFVLARLIVPEAFGTIALALVFITVLQHFASGGLSQAIIQHPRITKSHLDSVLVMSLVSGLVLSGALAALAIPIAGWLDQPPVGPVLIGLATMPLLVGISMVPEGWLSRQMDFRLLSIRHLTAAGFSVVVAVVLAVAGAGVWALVAQTVVESVVSCVFLWAATLRTYRPGLSVSRRAMREMIGYGSKVVGFDLTTVASNRADDFLVGAFLGPVALGLYSVAYRLLTVLQETLQGVASAVAFPLYSRLQDDDERLTKGFLRSSRLSFAVGAPIFLFAAIAAPQIVPVLLGARWMAAAPVMSVLSAAGIAQMVIEMNNTLLQAKGQAGRVFAFSVIGAVANVVGFVVAVPHGIVWVAAAFAGRAFLFLPLSLWLVAAESGGARAYLATYVPVLGALVVAGLAGFGAQVLDAELGSDVLALVVSGVLGVITYLGALRALSPPTYRDIVLVTSAVVGERLRRKQATA